MNTSINLKLENVTMVTCTRELATRGKRNGVN